MVLHDKKKRNIEPTGRRDIFHTGRANQYSYFGTPIRNESPSSSVRSTFTVNKRQRQPLFKKPYQYADRPPLMSPREDTKIRHLDSRGEDMDESTDTSACTLESSKQDTESFIRDKKIEIRLPLTRQKSDTLLLLESRDDHASGFKRTGESEDPYHDTLEFIAMLDSIGTSAPSVYSSTASSSSSTVSSATFSSASSASSTSSLSPTDGTCTSLVKMNSLRFHSSISLGQVQGPILVENSEKQSASLKKSIVSLKNGPSLFMDTSDSQREHRTPSLSDTTLSENHLKFISDAEHVDDRYSKYKDAIQSNDDKYGIDMKYNDEAFDVVASMMVERLESKELTAKEIEALAPLSVRRNFVDALNFRETLLPKHINNESGVIELTRKCIHLGLNRKDDENILITNDDNTTKVISEYKPPSDECIIPQTEHNIQISTGKRTTSNIIEEVKGNIGERPQTSRAASRHRDGITDDEMEKINRLQEQEKRLNEGINQLKALQKAMKKQQQLQAKLLSKQKISSPPQQEQQMLVQQKRKENQIIDMREEQKQFSLALSGTVSFHDDKYCIDLEADEEALGQNYVGDEGEGGSTLKSGISSLTFDHAQFFKSKDMNSKSYIDIVAPTDLPEGTMFDVQVGDVRMRVRVPKGGLKQGASFKNPIVIAQNIVKVPNGHWRDRIWNLYANGVCHPFTILPFIAPLLAIGQIMTRAKMNWLARPAHSKFDTFVIHQNLGAVFGFWLAINAILSWSFFVHWGRDSITNVDIGLFIGTNATMYCFIVFLTTKLRIFLRQKYQIPQACGCVMDFILSTLFTPLVIAQMGRHTGDYKKHKGYFFTYNGLWDEIDLSDPESSSMYTPPPFVHI